MAQGAGESVRRELGPEFDDVDWAKLDPRQYDPRRIVREALSDADFDPSDPLGLRSTSPNGANGTAGGTAPLPRARPGRRAASPTATRPRRRSTPTRPDLPDPR